MKCPHCFKEITVTLKAQAINVDDGKGDKTDIPRLNLTKDEQIAALYKEIERLHTFYSESLDIVGGECGKIGIPVVHGDDYPGKGEDFAAEWEDSVQGTYEPSKVLNQDEIDDTVEIVETLTGEPSMSDILDSIRRVLND